MEAGLQCGGGGYQGGALLLSPRPRECLSMCHAVRLPVDHKLSDHDEYTSTPMSTCRDRVRELDPFLAPNLPVYLSCLVEMKRKSELFHTAHQVPRDWTQITRSLTSLLVLRHTAR